MKRAVLIAILFLSAHFLCGGQDFGMMNRYRTAKVRVTVLDSGTESPVEYAAVYLSRQGDSTIANFAISGSNGVAVIEKVAQGKYDLNCELVGYKPFKKAVDIRLSEFENEKNLGRILMEQSREFIDAATVSAAGNPIVKKKDTLVYNANAYKTVENAMLADLLKKMPGIKVGSDGSVKVNGESVSRMTVDGKTFFQKDPGLAVKSLPAKIVDQIQVIDRAKDDAEFTGVGTGDDQEKVMDIMLKEEYQKGWFGNIKASGGASINGKSKTETPGNKVLFNSNAMVSHYSPTDQIMLLASGKNATEPGSWSPEDDFSFMMPGSENDELASKKGLQTTGQAGINYNTTKLKGLESTVSVSYNFQKKDVSEKSSRTSFQGEQPNLYTNGNFKGIGMDHTGSMSAELKNSDKGKHMFAFRPYFMFTEQKRETVSESTTRTGEELDNTSAAFNTIRNNNISTFMELETGIKDIGKERRSLTLSGETYLDNTKGRSSEKSRTTFKDSEDVRDLFYKNNEHSLGLELELTYVEPMGARWSLQARASGSYTGSKTVKDAFNGDDSSVNDYYSSFSRNDDMTIRERLLAQYKKDDTSILFGFQIDQEHNVTTARQLGIENTVGKNEWIINWAPYVNVVTKKEMSTLRFEYRGQPTTPSGSRIIPTLDISNPVQIKTGNIYLRPQYTHRTSLNYNASNTETYSMLELFMDGSIRTTPIVSASWFDKNGIRYSIPVNSRKPGADVSLYASYNQSFGKEKNFTFSLDGDISYLYGTGYQTPVRQEPMDSKNFNYDSLMKKLWGDASGSRFYSGESGFSESRTNTLTYSLFPTLAYKLEDFSATVMGFASNSITKYSLDKTADMNTWDFNVTGELLYSTDNAWQFNTDLGYNFYKGYSSGYGQPELIWNAGVAKDIKAFTLSFKVADILGQQKSIQRTTSSEYVEDIQRAVLGRYFLVGVVFNFGRMNAAQSSKVERAMWEMAY